MKQTNIDQENIQKKSLHITISHYRNERWTTKKSELTNERCQNEIFEFIEKGTDA